MKKIVTTFIAVALACTSLFAQDFNAAKEKYDAACAAVENSDDDNAVKLFQAAISIAEAVNADNEDLAAKIEELVGACKTYIPTIMLNPAKALVNAKNYEAAINELTNVASTAGNYGKEDIAAEAKAVIPTCYLGLGNAALNEKDYTKAAGFFQKVTEIDPANANAYLRLGMSYSRANDDKAVEALNKAAELGQANAANKELASFYLRKANNEVKAKNWAKAYEYAANSGELAPSANAYKIAGLAAYSAQKWDECISAYEKYIAASPNAKDLNQTIYRLADSFDKKGDKSKACGYYKQIVSDPNFKAYAEERIKALGCN